MKQWLNDFLQVISIYLNPNKPNLISKINDVCIVYICSKNFTADDLLQAIQEVS